MNLKIVVPKSLEFLYALIGLLLTIGGTFLEASITRLSGHWGNDLILSQSLGVTYQIGAVLLVGCLGGKNAAALSQIAYIVLGLTWMPVFTKGGGFDYLKEPSFGYLLGFVPGAWLCGFLAFQLPVRLEYLALSCISGLVIVHLVGLGFLGLTCGFNAELWLNEAIKYSLHPLPGQLAVVCAVSVLGFVVRQLLFY